MQKLPKDRLSMNKVLCIALTILLLLNIGCLDDGTDCGSAPQYIDIQGISGDNVAIGNSFSDFITIGSGITLTYSEFGIRAIPEVTYQSQAALKGGFRAYACSPPPPQPTEEIAEIAVFSLADYAQASSSKVFAAGDTLNALFKIYDSYSGRIVGLPDFLVDDDLAAANQPFTLQLTAAPQESTEHQFTVHYRLENGEFYEFTTDPITIVP
jgi:hypothetical protein